ncbi:Serine/threonine-protein kinase bur-1 [Amylocarpus encephaloides]|uniref:Serine/threonine-protein kinase BUR1 n=1 Tax=Amylocarpus encephaloides TaxID=45428 RepID=A0A9P7YFK4_9HELO|nr:Serine/threonine-protein kinase bur-1 [Amylocarpus encephaloides]
MAPKEYAEKHARPSNSFSGCSRIKNYEVLGKLGEGTFGEVHRARSLTTGKIVALKKILMHNEKDGFPITAMREIKLLKLLDHPNILRLEEMATEHHLHTKDKKKRANVYMVTPYMDHDLSGLLENPDVPKFTEPQIKCYMLQLLEGTRYLHEKHIFHRDMKAANLLINNQGILQIADFGLARQSHEDVPVAKGGGGVGGNREYTTLVVTRWYRPPELLLGMKAYTSAIDLWGVGCVFGEMLVGKPILAGDSDSNQLKIIFDLMGTPNDSNMPGWRSLPNSEAFNFPPRTGTLHQRFREFGSSACNLLSCLLNLNYQERWNAIDALQHEYFKSAPYPAKPGEIPTFESSHELDRRKARGQKAGLPPAPKGGTVGMGPNGGWGDANGHHGGNDGYGGGYNNRYNGSRYPPQGGHRNGIPPPPPEAERRPAWRRDDGRPDSRLPPRLPPIDYHDGGRPDRPDGYRSQSREIDRPPMPRNRQGGPNVDTYIPSYGGEGGRRDDRRRRDDRDDRGGERRHHDRERERLEYEDRSRSGRTRSRSHSPARDRDRIRDREPMDREREREREREVYRR